MRTEPPGGDLTHSADPLEILHSAKRVVFPFLDDGLRHAWADSREPAQLIGRREVHVDLLAFGERRLRPLLAPQG